MRGFETGLFLRTKGGSIEEYGCAAPATEHDNSKDNVFAQVKSAISTATMTLKLDPIVKDTFNVIVEFLDGFSAFLDVLSPTSQMDWYCTGMTFGL